MIMLRGDENAQGDVASGIYEKVRQIRPDDIVLDIGAHVGFFAEMAAAKAKHVYCFEPHPRNFAELLNRMEGKKNATCLNVACSGFYEWTRLYLNHGNTGGHSLWKTEGLHNGDSVNVLSVDIGDLIVTTELEPTFIKIDAEGAEAQIIHSMSKTSKIFLKAHFAYEVHSHELFRQCRDEFESLGFIVSPDKEHVGVCYADYGRHSPKSSSSGNS